MFYLIILIISVIILFLGYLVYKNYLLQVELKKCHKAIHTDPYNPKHYKNRAVVLTKLKNYQTALLDYNKAIELNPNDGSSYYYRAFLKAAMNDAEGASEDLYKIEDVDPDFYDKHVLDTSS